MNKGQKLLKKAKKLFQVEISFFQKGQNFFCLSYGPHITKKLRDVKFGIWKIINILISLGWGLLQLF